MFDRVFLHIRRVALVDSVFGITFIVASVALTP